MFLAVACLQTELWPRKWGLGEEWKRGMALLPVAGFAQRALQVGIGFFGFGVRLI